MGVKNPTGVVVVTHGQLATELLNAAEIIVGDLPGFQAVSIGWHDDVAVAHAAIAGAIAKVDAGVGVLVLTDMFGGTPSNLGLSFLEAGRVVVVTGVNLAMLINLAKGSDEADLLARARGLCEHGRAAIRVASDLLRADLEANTTPGGA
jgi:PTS system mannose-specific IIA component